jgi:hypothetical protein
MVKIAACSKSETMKGLVLVAFLAMYPALAMAQEAPKSVEIQTIDARLAELDRIWRREQAFLDGYKRNGVIRVKQGTPAHIACDSAIKRSQQAVAEGLTLEARKAELERAAVVVPGNKAAGAERLPKAGENPGKASKPGPDQPTSPKAIPPPTPAAVEVSNYKPSGAGALKILQEVRDADPVQKQELEFLEKRMEEIEVSLLAGMKKAASGTQPLQDLERSNRELKLISAVLENPEKCSYKNAIDALTEQLARTGAKFEEKSRKNQTGKAAYVEMLKEIELAKVRVDALRARFTALKHDVDGLVKNASEWITLYNDVLGIKGEAAARKTLTDLLAEKEKLWQKK